MNRNTGTYQAIPARRDDHRYQLDHGATHGCPVLIRMRSLGAILGAIRPNDFPRQANEYGQVGGDHASSRTDPNDGERPDRYLRIPLILRPLPLTTRVADSTAQVVAGSTARVAAEAGTDIQLF
jgi:hypothetical protein